MTDTTIRTRVLREPKIRARVAAPDTPRIRVRILPSLLPKQIELGSDGANVRWRYFGTDEWFNIVAIADLAATVEIGTTTTLGAGLPATAENVGTDQHVVLNLGIPRGADGASGVGNRTVLTADTTYHCIDYPSPMGVGGETGTGTAIDPFVGPQFALDWLQKNIDTAGYDVRLEIDSDIATENAPDGTTALQPDYVPLLGGGVLTIAFTGGSKVTCATSGNGILSVAPFVTLENADFDGIDDSVYFTHVIANNGEIDLVGATRFGKAGLSQHQYVPSGLGIGSFGTVEVYGSAASHGTAVAGGTIASGANYTLTGSPVFTDDFVDGDMNSKLIFLGTFTGPATGVLYAGLRGTSIVSLNTLPGDAPGTLDATSSYNGVFGIVIPPAGTTAQVLAKASDDDYDMEWVDQTGGGGGTVDSVVAGSGIDVDATDPANPVVSVETNLQTWNSIAPSANVQAIVSAANYAAIRALLDLEAGTDFYSISAADAAFQPKDSDLTSWAGVTRASGFDTWTTTPTSANLRALLSDETGTGLAYFQNGDLGTPSAGVATNLTGTASGLTSGAATVLATSRNIDGQSFNGSADITVIAPGTHAATGKTTPVDADELPLVDSAASNVLKKLTWANLKATLKTYLDTLYQPLASALTSWASVTRASGFDTFAATPSSANLRALLTDEAGTGVAYFVGGALGTPASGTATNLTGTASGLTAGNVTTNANLTGPITSVGNATSIASQTGTGTKFVVDTSPALTGSPTAPTQSARDNSTKIATTAYVDSATREKLSADRTYYVRTDGSDSNTGLANTSGGAFLTVAKAMAVAAALDCSIYNLTVQVGPGTWTVGVTLPVMVGSGTFTLLGDAATPSNVTISATSSDAINGTNAGSWSVNGFKLQTTTGGNGLVADTRTTIRFSNMDFGTVAGAHHIYALGVATIIADTGWTISGNTTFDHIAAVYGGYFVAYGRTITLSGVRTFSLFALATGTGKIDTGSLTFVGPTGTFSVTIASPAVFTKSSHGFIAGTPVVFSTTGALPTGLTAGTTYYVIAAGLTTNAFEVSATLGGSAVNTSGTQSGTHTVSAGALGSKYSVTLNGVTNVSGGGANYFPGNSAGSTATGGQYG